MQHTYLKKNIITTFASVSCRKLSIDGDVFHLPKRHDNPNFLEVTSVQ